jgi:hypothetical protein
MEPFVVSPSQVPFVVSPSQVPFVVSPSNHERQRVSLLCAMGSCRIMGTVEDKGLSHVG